MAKRPKKRGVTDPQGTPLQQLRYKIDNSHSSKELSHTATTLTSVPREIGQLRLLESLDLSGNKIKKLPSQIGQLDNLQVLRITDNQLLSLPKEITDLLSLKQLIAFGNRLERLPLEIGTLNNLETLTVFANRLTNLPKSIGNLSKLSKLDVCANDLSRLPDQLGELKTLRFFDASSNRLTELPATIGGLTNIRDLKLDGNRLVTLPSTIGKLSTLRNLDLSKNKLTILPPELGDLNDAINIHLTGNPLQAPLPTLLMRGTSHLLTYLRSIREGVERYEAKILLVGEGNVGKTSLLAALRDEQFIEGRITTHGINIGSLKLKHPTKTVKVLLNAWDFGGQEVYRITNQFFFSNRSLYILVWKPREGQEENAVEDWLRRIRLRVSDDVRVMIVATHCDERHPEIDYPYLEHKFGRMLAGCYQVDNKSGRGIQQLAEAIAQHAAQLPQMGERWSPRWVSARDELLSIKRPHLSHTTLVEMCRKHGLADNEISTLTTLLHDLGHFIHYAEDDGLRDIIVLQPEWLTKAIGFVLEDGRTREDLGVLEHTRLREIWLDHGIEGREAYDSGYHPYFLRLMEKFDVSFRIPDRSLSLIGQLVPYERPKLPWERNTPVVHGHRELSLVCEMDEDPPGLVAWLTVRNHRFSRSIHWRRGVFLTYQGQEALIEKNDDKELSITVRGHSPDHFMSLLRDGLQYLIQLRWPGLDYDLAVPCRGIGRKEQRCQGRFPFGLLQNFRERGMQQIPCQWCYSLQDIQQLVTGFEVPTAPFQEQLDQLMKTVSRVHDGIEDIKNYEVVSALQLRRLLRAATAETRESPRLFTLVPADLSKWNPRNLGQTSYKLTLWCEHPGCEHPCESGTYSIRRSKEWLARIGPYASLTAKALRVTVPIVGAALGVALDQTTFNSIKPQLQFMETLTSKVLTGEADVPDRVQEESFPLTAAEGAGLRELRTLLIEEDSSQTWGGLRRVLTETGDFLWVCGNHYVEYDPGLPELSTKTR